MTTRWTDSSGRKKRSLESPLMSLCVVASMISHAGRQMAGKTLGEPFDGQVFGWCREVAPDALFRLGRDEGSRGVVSFKNELPAEQLVSAAI